MSNILRIISHIHESYNKTFWLYDDTSQGPQYIMLNFLRNVFIYLYTYINFHTFEHLSYICS